MEYIDQTLREFLSSAASPRPTPGGGAVAALTAALGVTMAEMAANFTLGKKRFANVQMQVQDLRDKLSSLRSRLVKMMDADAEAFTRLQTAQHMPKSNTEEIGKRQIAINKASAEASGVPAQAAELIIEALERTKELAEICNPKLISDVGVCVHLCKGALESAHLNVQVNLQDSVDLDLVDSENAKIRARLERAEDLVRQVLNLVDSRGHGASPAQTGFFDIPQL